MADVPLLTASMADDINLLSTFGNHPVMDVRIAVDAIATGRTKTVVVRSEGEWLEECRRWVGTGGTLYGQRAWLAALRSLGLVSGEQGGGNG